MPLKNVFVIARGNSGRPTCQHRLLDGQAGYTACGINVSNWSRAYMNKRIDEVLCQKGACRG